MFLRTLGVFFVLQLKLLFIFFCLTHFGHANTNHVYFWNDNHNALISYFIKISLISTHTKIKKFLKLFHEINKDEKLEK